jgi:hypothetical protein
VQTLAFFPRTLNFSNRSFAPRLGTADQLTAPLGWDPNPGKALVKEARPGSLKDECRAGLAAA